MKKFLFTLFLYFLSFAATAVYAGNNNLTVNFPAPSGSYNKLVLQNLKETDTTLCQGGASSAGMLFYNQPTQSLEMCTGDGTGAPVPYPETCFNRFCSCDVGGCDTVCTNTNNFNYGIKVTAALNNNPCPVPYFQATSNGNYAVTDNFSPDSNIQVYSTVCCNNNSTVLPSS